MSSVQDWEAPNPVKDNRSGLIGKGVDRYEGPLKVTGAAPYAYEVTPPSPPAYGVMVGAEIATGRITGVDTVEAEAAPGVLAVWTHRNVPAQPPRGTKAHPRSTSGSRPALESDRVTYFGQPVAFVVADTLENATAAAKLVRLTYTAADPDVDFPHRLDAAGMPPGEQDTEIGDFEAGFAASDVKLDETWTTPIQNHCQMEPCASVAWWEGGKCIAHTSVQMVKPAQHGLAETLGIGRDDVHLLTRYIGGGFGGKGQTYDDLTLAALAARALGRPVKVAFTRQQMMHGTIHRPATIQRVRLGAGADGRLNAMSLMTWTHCQRDGAFTEHASNFARNLYAAPNRLTGHRLVKLDLPHAGAMRAPGEASGTLSLECAMDELAEKLGLDPIELRIRNEPEVDPENGRPFSMRQLVRCMKEGAQLFGWDRRLPTPGQVRDGRWLVGLGMAAAIRGNFLLPAKCSFSVDADGVITVRQGMTDIGTGTYTVLAQIAAETLGVPLGKVVVEIGDSELPPAPGSGGQFGAATAGSAALAAGMNLRQAIAELAVADPGSPLHGGDPNAVTFQDGVVALENRSETLAELVRRAAPAGLTVEGEIRPAQDAQKWSQQTYGAHFCEVGVDPVSGEVRVRRMLGVFAAGRILNAKTARSQLTGGMIWGVASALHEGNAPDLRYGSLLGQDLGNYLVTVQADVGELDAIMLDEVDDKANPMGIKGVGELGNSGAGAAVANAIYNACGVRVRDYPITPDKLLPGLIAKGW
ncbi:xanthine dehydrogenase family protein molybdopterin-binding subunit [Phenylobacterium kunshanense]|uniref:Xanthine dehydrogenase family protein molybdopterin-binding subunit n=1 Tax=Phenylobacterium kunshanense TaxID=1445034 RepID=A0A328B771_9CAUL|nr:xanthine dehydrogenase family protein molybdopterin-binding subunit [Phenylobacterium kunshanense]RAK62747.1 xanthine dehydrogenase family protein molybdopterin-binding subunit [Phenylobacterium kunshanense]